MPYFSKRSSENLDTCHKDLIFICSKAIEIIDFSVLCGYRNQSEQEFVYNAGNSKLHYPDSKHNKKPALAVDIAPYPLNWKDINKFYELKGVIFTVAHYLKANGAITHKLKWGGKWKMKDYPHYQLEEV
jgi:peptidoglycan L-alanyl-D-glutamate endopeptidase CwlK